MEPNYILNTAVPLVGAASATSGLIFVFLGMISSRLAGMQTDVRRIAASRYRGISWLALLALFLSAFAAVIALIALGNQDYGSVTAAIRIWIVALLFVLLSAASVVKEI